MKKSKLTGNTNRLSGIGLRAGRQASINMIVDAISQSSISTQRNSLGRPATQSVRISSVEEIRQAVSSQKDQLQIPHGDSQIQEDSADDLFCKEYIEETTTVGPQIPKSARNANRDFLLCPSRSASSQSQQSNPDAYIMDTSQSDDIIVVEGKNQIMNKNVQTKGKGPKSYQADLENHQSSISGSYGYIHQSENECYEKIDFFQQEISADAIIPLGECHNTLNSREIIRQSKKSEAFVIEKSWGEIYQTKPSKPQTLKNNFLPQKDEMGITEEQEKKDPLFHVNDVDYTESSIPDSANVSSEEEYFSVAKIGQIPQIGENRIIRESLKSESRQIEDPIVPELDAIHRDSHRTLTQEPSVLESKEDDEVIVKLRDLQLQECSEEQVNLLASDEDLVLPEETKVAQDMTYQEESTFNWDEYNRSQQAKVLKAPQFVPRTQEEVEYQEKELQDEIIQFMISREHSERLKVDYFQVQTQFRPEHRLKLYSWMNELCFRLNMRRQTFYASLNMCDRFFEKVQCLIQVDDLQLVAIVAISVAAKQEERMIPSLEVFRHAVDNAYTLQQISLMEQKMISVLKFRLNPVTLVFWLDYYTKKWDEFADQYNIHTFSFAENCASFRTESQGAYNRYRAAVNFVDAVVLDYEQYQYSPRELIASVLYLVIGGPQTLGVFPDYAQIALNFRTEPPVPSCNQQYYEQGNLFFDPAQAEYYNQQIFGPFLGLNFGLTLEQIRPCVAYVARFFGMGLDFAMPDLSSKYTFHDENGNEITDNVQENYEECLGAATFNQNTLAYVEFFMYEQEQEQQQQQQNSQGH